ncbi:MAG: class F sortase [Propionibacteriales bacterium]|nr:class F sortase [Propionibacteriales bacterium]
MALDRRFVHVSRAAVALLLVLVAQVLVVITGSGAIQTAGAVPASCKRPANGFVPSRAEIPAIGRTVKVIQVKRTSSGQVGAGPVTQEGKWLMAMDPQTKPASRKGSVILSGHTWPDGSALGNAMLRDLHRGDGIVLTGSNGRRACYRITERTSYPVDEVPRNKAFRYWGPEQVVIVACSGKRLGPGNWTRRTIWYGVPVAPTPPPPAQPPAEEEPPSLLGGLLGGLLG